MRSIRYPMILVIVAGVAVLQIHGQKSDKDSQYKDMVALIEAGNFEFKVQSVNPSGGRTIRPTTLYTMVAKDGMFRADLPYFGRAYQPSYGGNGGIAFNGTPETIKTTLNERKRNITLEFKIGGDGETYNVTLTAGHSGYGDLFISMTRRQSISYYGTISPLKGTNE